MDEISKRQLAILRAVISEFLGREVEAVPSSIIVRRYKIDACPATVRNEMVQLERQGLLKKSHISSGRIPSDLGIKYFLRNILSESELSPTVVQAIDTVFAKVKGTHSRLERVLKAVFEVLDEPVFIFYGNILITKGLYRLSKYPETSEPEIITSVLHFLENKQHFDDLTKHTDSLIFTIIGNDLKYSDLTNVAVVAKKFSGKRGTPGVIGTISSKRLSYPQAIPIIRYAAESLDTRI